MFETFDFRNNNMKSSIRIFRLKFSSACEWFSLKDFWKQMHYLGSEEDEEFSQYLEFQSFTTSKQSIQKILENASFALFLKIFYLVSFRKLNFRNFFIFSGKMRNSGITNKQSSSNKKNRIRFPAFPRNIEAIWWNHHLTRVKQPFKNDTSKDICKEILADLNRKINDSMNFIQGNYEFFNFLLYTAICLSTDLCSFT